MIGLNSIFRDNLGGKLKAVVSGGSSIPSNIDEFMNLINLNLLAGYGLSETSPVIASRKIETNILGTVGTLFPNVNIVIKPFDEFKQTNNVSESIEKVDVNVTEGVLWVKGPGS